MKKNKLKIGDVARELGIKKSLIRQWEQEFGLKTGEQAEHQRYYSSDDMTILSTIRDLIRTQGLSIHEAKAHLKTLPATQVVVETSPSQPQQSQPQPQAPLQRTPAEENIAQISSERTMRCATVEEQSSPSFEAPETTLETTAAAPQEEIITAAAPQEMVSESTFIRASETTIPHYTPQERSLPLPLTSDLLSLKQQLIKIKELLS